MTLAAADRAEVQQLVRDQLHLLLREALPASMQARVLDAAELRASEIFNLTSRTRLTLDDLTPAVSAFLQVDGNGFATYATGGGGGYSTIQDEGTPLTARSTINFIGAGVTASDVGGLTQVSIPGGGGGATISRGTLAARPTAAALGSGNVYYTTDTFQLVRSNGATYDEIGLEDIFTTKGDLIGASAADTPGRFAVGTDGQCIIASSADTLGLKYVGLGSVTGALVKAQSPLTTKGDLWVTDGTSMHRLAAGTDGQALLALASATDGLQWAGLATIAGALVKAQSPLTTKGDLWVTDGTSMHRLAVGTDNQVLGALASATDGLNWIGLGSITGSIVKAQTPLTTKGDLLSIDGTTLHRVGVGTNGQGLMADSTQTDGIRWSYPLAILAQQLARDGATANGLPRCSHVREAVDSDVASSFASGVMTFATIFLEANQVISRIGMLNGATAGATLTHRWAAIYTPNGVTFAKQSTDVTTATTTANTWLEFTLSSTYTVPSDGLYVICIMFAGTTPPTGRGTGLGNGIVSAPTGATGVTFPISWGTAGSALTTTAPAGPLTLIAQGRAVVMWAY